jgi:hypothetical protein
VSIAYKAELKTTVVKLKLRKDHIKHKKLSLTLEKVTSK